MTNDPSPAGSAPKKAIMGRDGMASMPEIPTVVRFSILFPDGQQQEWEMRFGSLEDAIEYAEDIRWAP